MLPNQPLQQPNATRARSEVGSCRDRRGLRPRLLAAVIRSKATLAFAAERVIVRQTGLRELCLVRGVRSGGMRGGSAGRTKLALAAMLGVVTVIALAVRLIHSKPRPSEHQLEAPWQWDDEARVEICLSIPGASGTGPGDADLLIDGTLAGAGEMHGDNRDTGNVVGCEDYPDRYIDVRDGEKRTWRMMYGLVGLRCPNLRTRVGAHVRFRFYSILRNGRTADLLLTDEAGPVLAIEQGEHGPRPLEGMSPSVGWGRSLGRRSNPCGGEEVARALRVSGDTDAMVPPGQTGSVRAHGTSYRLWNAGSVAVVGTACVDEDDRSSWVLWRE